MRRLTRRPRSLLAALAAVIALAPVLAPSAGSVAQAATGTSRGYWFVAGDGGIFSFGDARFQGSTGNLRLNQPIVGMATTPTGNGYWFVAADGGIFSFGDAKFFGSTGAMRLNRPIVGMAPTPTGRGYWFVASDGGIFSFGDAKFFGSTGAMKLNKPIVGMAASPTGNGYWFVASDGGIFSFGDAKFFGSTGTAANRSPIVSIAASPTGKGYWFAAQDGSVHAFGDAGFFGSMGGRPLTTPIVGMSVTQTGRGYWLVGTDGGVFSFGDAGFFGSTGAMRLNRPIVGLAAAPPSDGTANPGPGPGPGGTSPTTGNPGDPGGTTTTVPGTPTTTPPSTIPPGNINWGPTGTTERLIKGSAGGGDAFRPWMSDDGRYVVFDSAADNVLGKVNDVTVDSNGIRDVFLYDRNTNTYTRINVPTGGGQATGASEGDNRGTDLVESERATISGDGCRIAFWSGSTNLVEGDTNEVTDAFVHDRCVAGGRTVRVSVGPDGAQANDYSARPVISRNGRYVAFESAASNLIAGSGGLGGILPGGGGSDTNGAMDVFLHDLGAGELGTGGVTSRVSVTDAEGQANGKSVRPSISADGTKIAFQSDASNLGAGAITQIFVRDIHASATRLVSAAAAGTPADKSNASPSISSNGQFVAFASRATNLTAITDNDGKFDIYVKDMAGGGVTLASVSSAGTPGNNLAEGSVDPTISGDGKVVAFWSDASNLVEGDTNASPTAGAQGWDVFVRDCRTGTCVTKRASVSSAGAQANRNAFSPALSTDGRFLAFDSDATTLATPAEAPTSRSQDIFVHVL